MTTKVTLEQLEKYDVHGDYSQDREYLDMVDSIVFDTERQMDERIRALEMLRKAMGSSDQDPMTVVDVLGYCTMQDDPRTVLDVESEALTNYQLKAAVSSLVERREHVGPDRSSDYRMVVSALLRVAIVRHLYGPECSLRWLLE